MTRTLTSQSWDNHQVAKLWRYNLHYFDDLNAEGASGRSQWHKELIERWVNENQPSVGSGWEPYPTSLRIINWIKWELGGNKLSPAALQSLAIQTRWLSKRLEYHLLGNHLFANAKALVFSGCFFEGVEADRWLRTGMRILAKEIPEQILSDGGQFELSPMYHALALEDMLDLVNLLRAAGEHLPEHWHEKTSHMREWLAAMSHPDGEISFFNDAAMGIAPTNQELESYAQRLGYPPMQPVQNGCSHLSQSGYIRLQNNRTAMIMDVARVGPDYLPGHAHADTLSFELSVDDQRVLVNSGTSVYGSDHERLRQRGTASHNTVVVDNKDSSEVWSGFRVARRAGIRGLSIENAGDKWTVSCAHDGYERLPGKVKHHRAWQLDSDGIVVRDAVEGDHSCAEAIFHIHPHLRLVANDDRQSGRIENQAGPVMLFQIVRGVARFEATTWHREFGLTEPSQKLIVTLIEGESVVEFCHPQTPQPHGSPYAYPFPH